MPTIRELITRFGFEVDESKIAGVNKAVGEIKSKLDGATGNLTAFANGLTSAGTKLTTFVTLPIAALGAVSVKAASDAEETKTKFQTVFKDIGESAATAAGDLRDNFGLARSSAQKLLGDTGDMLTGFGFTQQAALDLATDTNKLAVDLASFTNVQGGSARASRALTKALLGERESVKELGIAILEKDVKERVALNRAKGLRFATERQAKAVATLQIAQEQSKNAIGDFARTQESTANRMRVFRERLKEISEEFGAVLLPAVNRVLKGLTGLLKRLSDLSPKTKKWIVGLALAAASIGPLLLAVGTLLKLFIAFKVALLFMSAPMALILGKFILIGAAIAAVIALVGLVIQDFVVWAQGGDSLIGSLLGDFEKFRGVFVGIWNGIKTAFVAAWEFMVETVRDLLTPFVESLTVMFGGLLQFFGGFFQVLGGIFSGNLQMIGDGFVAMFNGLIDYLKGWAKWALNVFLFPFRVGWKAITGLFKAGIGGITALFKNRQSIGEALGNVGEGLSTSGSRLSDVPLSDLARPGSTTNNGANVTTNVEVNATLPPGSTEQQARELERLTTTNTRGAMTQEARKMVQANPVVE